MFRKASQWIVHKLEDLFAWYGGFVARRALIMMILCFILTGLDRTKEMTIKCSFYLENHLGKDSKKINGLIQEGVDGWVRRGSKSIKKKKKI